MLSFVLIVVTSLKTFDCRFFCFSVCKCFNHSLVIPELRVYVKLNFAAHEKFPLVKQNFHTQTENCTLKTTKRTKAVGGRMILPYNIKNILINFPKITKW